MNVTLRTLIVLTVTCAFGLGACGVRGALEPPPDAKRISGNAKPETQKEHRPFILDRLIK